jgi:hypothetical protein
MNKKFHEVFFFAPASVDRPGQAQINQQETSAAQLETSRSGFGWVFFFYAGVYIAL